jgi:hypothetical protein
LCGIALGAALLTKSTAYIFLPPFLIILVGVLCWERGVRAIAPLLAVGAIALAMNTPSYVRNYRFSHTLLGAGGFGPQGGAAYANAHKSLGVTVSNLLRNSGLELAVNLPEVTHDLEAAIRQIHAKLGLNPDDPDTEFGGVFQLRGEMWNQEDCAADPVHFLLASVAVLLLLNPTTLKKPAAAMFALSIIIGFIGFSGYLRWQPWHTRLLLPLLVLSAAFVGLALERHVHGPTTMAIIGILPMLVIPLIAGNYMHPLVGERAIFNASRETRYFQSRPRMQAGYRDAVDYAQAHNCREIGLIIGSNDWEYPLIMMLRARLPDVRVEAYPGAILTAASLHTFNKGWDENLKPYLVVRVQIEQTSLVQFVDSDHPGTTR